MITFSAIRRWFTVGNVRYVHHMEYVEYPNGKRIYQKPQYYIQRRCEYCGEWNGDLFKTGYTCEEYSDMMCMAQESHN